MFEVREGWKVKSFIIGRGYLLMIVEKVLKAMARMRFEKLLGSPSRNGIREKLGDSVDLLCYQERMLGALSLSRSMGPILFETGRRPAVYMLMEMCPVGSVESRCTAKGDSCCEFRYGLEMAGDEWEH
jgi:predicted hydrocarbon binding protein